MLRRLAAATSPETTGATIVLVPVGSLEQHGPHLPLDTDTVIAEAVTHGVAARLTDAWVAPPIAYGASGEHQSFAGTSSIGTEALQHLVIELVRSMRTWARRVVLVNGHGGNVRALTNAVDQLVGEGHDVAWVPCAAVDGGAGDAHAGFTETSLMLHLRPGSVRLDLAVPGSTAPLTEILPALVAGGVGAVSPNGVLGDPAGATADQGRRVLDAMVADVCRRLVLEPAR
jgi:mycofactocin system creatininase family protein